MKHTAYKGIVVKITDLHLVILQDNGRYKNVPKNAIKQVPLLGQSITYVEKASSLRWVSYISVAALLFLSFISYSIFQSVKPSYLLVMDINPSFEMEVSEKGEVIDLRALNEDAEGIVSSVKDSNRDVLYMIDLLVKDAKKKGYLAKNPMITTSLISLEEDDITLPVKEINDALTSYVQGEHVQVEVKEAALVEYKEAKKLNLSVNFYQQYQVLIEKELVEDLNDIKGKTILELKSMASQPNKEIEEEDKEAQLIPNDTDQVEAKSKVTEKQPTKAQVPNDHTKENVDQNTSEKSRSQNPKEAESKEKTPMKIDNGGDKQKSVNEQENKEIKKDPPKIENPQKEETKPPKAEERVEEKQKIKQPPNVKESEESEENKNQRSEKTQENPSIEKENEKGKNSEKVEM